MKHIFILIAALSMLFKQDKAVVISTTLEADASKNTYELINSVLAPGHNVVEVSDCSHISFGPHITQEYDKDLNKDVFIFHGHVELDTDRCKRFDKQRVEIKTYSKSPEITKGVSGEKHSYRWLFQLDKDFQASPHFTHIHQIKAVGGSQDKMPTITYTLRDKNDIKTFDIRYAANMSQETVVSANLEAFLGEWIVAEETIVYGEKGSIEITLSRKRDNKILLTYKSDLRMWKDNATFLRPKWGLYRSLKSKEQLRDEKVKFADFSITELKP